MAEQVIIHAGLPKCASTTLQLKYFNNHPCIYYIGSSLKAVKQPEHVKRQFEELDYFKSEETPDLVEDDRYYSSLFYKHDLEKLRAQNHDPSFTSNYLKEHVQKKDADQKIVVSCEGFSVNTLVPAEETARRLKKSFPDAKVFFIIRNPFHWLMSRYIQMFRGIPRKIKSMPSYSEWLEFHFDQKEHHQSVYYDLRWDKLLDNYEVLFGRENVRVFLFEQFLKENKTFENELSEFMGVDLTQISNPNISDHFNTTITKGDYMLKRKFAEKAPVLINPLSLYLAKNLIKGKPKPILSTEMTEKTMEFLKPILDSLQDKWNLPLERFDYPMS